MNDGHVSIIVRDSASGDETAVARSEAFNWQMGARAIWIDDDTIAWNGFDGAKYVCNLYSLTAKEIVRVIPMAVMDIDGRRYALGTNWQRLRSVDPDYSYSCLPELTEEQFLDYDNDGIWLYDFDADEKRLLLSITDILACKGRRLHREGRHSINHIMISPDGSRFMFIHRYKHDGKKFDRLMMYDFDKLTCLLDDPLQSHFCWVDNDNIMGYCGHDSRVGWHWVDVTSGQVTHLDELTAAHPKNGHPTVCGDWIVVDSYPSLSRMQTLTAYNHKTRRMVKLAEVFHDLDHRGYNRCDLHPRLNADGTKLFFDSIYEGKRGLYWIDLNLDYL